MSRAAVESLFEAGAIPRFDAATADEVEAILLRRVEFVRDRVARVDPEFAESHPIDYLFLRQTAERIARLQGLPLRGELQ